MYFVYFNLDFFVLSIITGIYATPRAIVVD